MTEKEIERRMCKLIKERGGLTYKFSSPNNPGVPDRIVITRSGAVWFVELKSEKGQISKMQEFQITLLTTRGVNVRVLRGWDEAKNFVERLFGNGI